MIGFDYGTSNCGVATMENGQPKITPLLGNESYIASNLYAPSRDVSLRARDELLDGKRDPTAAGRVYFRLPKTPGAQA